MLFILHESPALLLLPCHVVARTTVACSHSLAETLDASALRFLLLLARVNGMAIAAGFNFLLPHRTWNGKNGVTRCARDLCILKNLWMDSFLHSRGIVQRYKRLSRKRVSFRRNVTSWQQFSHVASLRLLLPSSPQRLSLVPLPLPQTAHPALRHPLPPPRHSALP